MFSNIYMPRVLRIMRENTKSRRAKDGKDKCAICGDEIKLGMKYYTQYNVKGRIYHESCFKIVK